MIAMTIMMTMMLKIMLIMITIAAKVMIMKSMMIKNVKNGDYNFD